MISAVEIRGPADPLPRLELLPAADLLALDPGALLDYALDLQQDLEAVRATLHAAVALVADQTVTIDRLRAQQARLLDEYRALRVQVLG